MIQKQAICLTIIALTSLCVTHSSMALQSEEVKAAEATFAKVFSQYHQKIEYALYKGKSDAMSNCGKRPTNSAAFLLKICLEKMHFINELPELQLRCIEEASCLYTLLLDENAKQGFQDEEELKQKQIAAKNLRDTWANGLQIIFDKNPEYAYRS